MNCHMFSTGFSSGALGGKNINVDVGWDLEPAGGVPSGPVDDEYSVSAWCHQGRDFIKMPLHGLSVAAGQDKARTDTARGTDGTEDIRPTSCVGPGAPWVGGRVAPSAG